MSESWSLSVRECLTYYEDDDADDDEAAAEAEKGEGGGAFRGREGSRCSALSPKIYCPC